MQHIKTKKDSTKLLRRKRYPCIEQMKHTAKRMQSIHINKFRPEKNDCMVQSISPMKTIIKAYDQKRNNIS